MSINNLHTQNIALLIFRNFFPYEGHSLFRRFAGGDEEPIGIQYLAGSDRIVFWNKHSLGVRSDYNGVLLLHTVLQQPVYSANTKQPIKIELFLSEVIYWRLRFLMSIFGYCLILFVIFRRFYCISV